MLLSIVALGFSVLPVTFAHPKAFGGNHGHQSLHSRPWGTGTGVPYSAGNATSYGPTGTGTGYGTGYGTGLVVTATVSPVAAGQNLVGNSSCGPATVTVTSSNTFTVTVQPSSSVAAPYGLGNSSTIAPTGTGFKTGYTSKASGGYSSVVSPVYTSAVSKSSPVYSSVASPVYTSASSSSIAAYSSIPVSSYSSPSSSSAATSVAAATGMSIVENHKAYSSVSLSVVSSSSAVSPAVSSVAASSSASASATSSVATKSPTSTGKRGLVYNDASLLAAFTSASGASSELGWTYNWAQQGSGIPSGLSFVPMLHDGNSGTLSGWATNAAAALSAGTEYFMSFNEPDEIAAYGGSNLSPSQAAALYKSTFMTPFAGKSAQLGSPAVTNGGGSMGLTWLSNFISACSGCQIDFTPLHWYGGDTVTNSVADLQSHIATAYQQTGKPIWLTEFRYTGSGNENDFLNTILPWLDGQASVARYAYFMVTDGILSTGSGLSSPLGTTYATCS